MRSKFHRITRQTKRKPYEVDLGAEKIIAAERGTDYIAVEIKSFIGSSLAYDFHRAFGQFGIYRFFIATKDPNRKLFLALTEEIYNSFFQDVDIQAICDYFHVNLLIFDSENKTITTWLEK